MVLPRYEVLIGGATEATIIARIGQGIVSAVGMAHSHSDVLREPDWFMQRYRPETPRKRPLPYQIEHLLWIGIALSALRAYV